MALEDAERDCSSAVSAILSGRVVYDVKRFFTLAGITPPSGNRLGIIDLEQSSDCVSCVFRVAWGLRSYCGNQPMLSVLMSRYRKESTG
jgi:hypothetical protein